MPECLDCLLFDCDRCALDNDEWYLGACCCGRIKGREEDDDEYGDDDA